VQFYLAVINTYKAINLVWQCNFEILVALLQEKSNLHELSNKQKMWYLVLEKTLTLQQEN